MKELMKKTKNLTNKLFNLILTFVFVLSLTAMVPAYAASEVTATVNGAPIASGNTIDAVSTIVFTLPNAISDADLATAVKFYEVRKGTATTTDTTNYVVKTASLTWDGTDWSSRLYDGDVNGNIVTVTFSEGDLAANSRYLFVFSTPAVETEENFVFSTTSADYYYNENFDRYPVTGSSTGNSSNISYEIQSPWWSYAQSYSRIQPSIEDNNGDKFLRLTSATTSEESYKSRGSIALDNSYAKAYTGSTSNGYYDEYVVESTFSISGNATSIFQVGPIVIRTENGVTGLYYRTTGNLHKNYDTIATDTTSLNRPITTISATATEHTIKYVASSKNTFGEKKVYQLWFDNQQVTLPDSGLDISLTELLNKNVEYADPVNFYGSAGMGLVLSALQFKVPGSSDPNTIMDVYTYKVYPLKAVFSIKTADNINSGLYDPITIQFGDKPKVTPGPNETIADKIFSELMNGDITITDAGDRNVSFTSDGYDEETNSIEIVPVALEHNQQYTVTVQEREYALLGTGAATTYTFTTGWEKLEASLAESAVAASSMTPPEIQVKSITSAETSYDTTLVLYRTKNGMVNQVASTTTPQAALGSRENDTITVGSVTDTNPDAEATYFAKIFFLSGGEAIAEPIVIGTDPKAAVSEISSATSVINFDPVPNVNLGRFDVKSKCVHSLPERAMWIVATDPNGSVVYYDQLTNGQNGNFAFGFNLVQGAAVNGEYTVTVKPSGAQAFDETTLVSFDSVQPEVTRLEIQGTPAYKFPLTADYSIYDFVGRENNSLVEWWIAESENSDYAKVGEGATYTVPASEIGKYLKCYITPRVVGGTADGVLYTTDDAGIAPIYLASAPEASSVSLSQASGANSVVLSYETSDPKQHEPGVHKVNWKITEENGTLIRTVSNSDLDVYTVTASDHGKYLQAEFTPCMLLGTCQQGSSCRDCEDGEMVTSNRIQMTYTATEVGSLGGNGNGGGGGGNTGGLGIPVEKPSAPIYQAPQDNEKTDVPTIDFPDVRGHWAEKEIFALYDAGIVSGRSETEFAPDAQITRAEFVAIMVRGLHLEAVAYQGSFADVSSNAWYADVLETAKQNGLFEGSDGYANPEQQITREEMTAIVVRAYEKYCGDIVVGGGLLNFNDATDISSWAWNAVIKATAASLVNGTGDDNFSPKSYTTRAQGAVILTRLMNNVERAIGQQAALDAQVAEEVVQTETEADSEITADASALEENKEDAVSVDETEKTE